MTEREDVRFTSGDAQCAAWLYRPEGVGPHACVVLAHGFGGTRKARLWAYAERFREAGMAALVFDYRHFGDSGGEPRQLISIRRQLEDWKAAVAYARALPGVDPKRIALWGTSYSGGHVIRIAAEDPGIAAVVSQTPFTTGASALRAAGFAAANRLGLAAVRDGLRALMGRPPRPIPLAARPGE